MAKLNTFVHVVELDENGQAAGRSGTFGPDDELPDWAIASISNPDVWAEAPAAAAAEPADSKAGKPAATIRKAAAPKAAKPKAEKESTPPAPPPGPGDGDQSPPAPVTPPTE